MRQSCAAAVALVLTSLLTPTASTESRLAVSVQAATIDELLQAIDDHDTVDVHVTASFGLSGRAIFIGTGKDVKLWSDSGAVLDGEDHDFGTDTPSRTMISVDSGRLLIEGVDITRGVRTSCCGGCVHRLRCC